MVLSDGKDLTFFFFDWRCRRMGDWRKWKSRVRAGIFPGCPVAEDSMLPVQQAQVQSLVRQLDPTCRN